MKISVITVCYNCESEIEDTIKSVISQSYSDLEYIVIDGASKDNTLSIINKYSDMITKIVSEPDKGIYDAMNKGIELATGEWINFMNAGDAFADNKVIEEFFAMADINHPNELLYGDTIIKYSHGLYYKDCHPEDGKEHWCHQSLFARTALMKKYKYDLSFRLRADAYFLHTVQQNGGRMVYYPRVVSIYCNGGASSMDTVGLHYETQRIFNIKKDFAWYKELYTRKYYQFKSRVYNWPIVKCIIGGRKKGTLVVAGNMGPRYRKLK